MGGVVGLGIVAGSLFIWGPLAIGPAIILGVAAGAIVDSMVKIRRLLPNEEDFVKDVFGDSLDFERIRLTNLVGLEGRPFTMPTVDNHILVNIGVSDAIRFAITISPEEWRQKFPSGLYQSEGPWGAPGPRNPGTGEAPRLICRDLPSHSSG